LHFVLVFLPLWWIWVGQTIYANRLDTDGRQHRLSTLLMKHSSSRPEIDEG
jgi:low temperature requirement protein LtrA